MNERWQQVENVFHDVMEREPHERMQFLDLVCVDDPDLRDEVKRLILSYEQAGSLLQSAFNNATEQLFSNHDIAPGTQLGPYKIEALLGAGGMGQVFRATDHRLSRQVAIKILLPGGQGAEHSTERLLREARSASALNHPNIVTVHDIGTSGTVDYIVMELVQGDSLRGITASGPLTIPRVLAIARQIGDALAAAHGKGILHRDLKPANVMVTSEGIVKLLDFGLAKFVVPESNRTGPDPEQTVNQTQLPTVEGTIVGTFGYMSPEQVRGEKLDLRSDQFSFGVVLYEMVTGRRAFTGATVMDTLVAIVRDTPEPMRHLNPLVPAPLEWIVDRCLAKDRQDRYGSTRELASDLDALAVSLAQVRPAAPNRVHNLPPQRTGLVGREQDLAKARLLVLRPNVRLVTFTGPGGIGKTRMAVELSRQLLDEFPGGIVFVALDRIGDATLVPSEIAAAMNLRHKADETAMTLLERQLLSLAAPTLLVLDNFEHVVSAVPQVIHLLALSDQLKVLVTSRAALHAYGEYEYPVPPLGLPDSTTAPAQILAASPAVALFLERVPGLQATGTEKLDESQIRLIAEICTRLDGLPLAIELAAARTKVLPLRALLDRVRDPLQLLVGGPKDVPARQRTLRATIDWSYNLLDSAQQTLFRRLSVFVGGATHEGIEAVANAKGDMNVNLLEAIESLVDNSLLRQTAGDVIEPRFSMLETVREYGLARLAEAGEEVYTRKAHAAYYVVLAEDGNAEMAGPLRQLWFARFNAETGNFGAALDWMTSAREAHWGMRLVVALVAYWRDRGHLLEGSERVAKLLALPEASIKNRTRACLLAAGVDLSPENSVSEMFKMGEESLQIFKELRDIQGVLRVTNSHAARLVMKGDYEGSRRHLEELVTAARETGDPVVLAGALNNLANTMQLLGEYEASRRLYEESVSRFEAAGDQIAVVWGLNHLADVARAEGHHDQARSLYEQALERFRRLQHQLGIAACHFDLANLDADAGDDVSAEQLLGESLRIYASLGYRSDLPRVLEAYACCAALAGDPERALTLAGSAAGLRELVGRQYELPKSKLARHLEESRRQLSGSQAATSWMRGWNMSTEEAVLFAKRSS